MVYLFLLGDAFPLAINFVEPDVVDVGDTVVVNIELTHFRVQSRWWGPNVVHGRRGIPDRIPRRA